MIAKNHPIAADDPKPDATSASLSQVNSVALLALFIGLVPLLSGLMFRTYQYHVTPGWYEALRQLDLPFLLVEIGVMVWAHARGLRFMAFFKSLDRPMRFAALVFFGTFWISSAFVSPVPGYSLLRLFYWFIHIGFAVSVWHLGKNNAANSVGTYSKWAVIGVAAYLPVLVLHFTFSPDPADTRLGEIIWSSAVPGALSVRHFGIWMGGVLALWIGHTMWLKSGNTPDLRNWMITAALMALMFWSGTRAAMVAVLGVLLVSVIAMWRLPSWKETGAMFAAIIVGLGLSTLAFMPDSSFGIVHLDRYLLNDDANAMSSGRIELWTDALTKFAQNPIIGWGEGSLYWLVDLDGVSHLQPHNSVVQFLFSWGLIATCAAAYVMLRLLWTLHTAVRDVPAMLAPLMMADATLIMSLFDGALYFTRMIMPGAAALALCFCLLEAGKHKLA